MFSRLTWCVAILAVLCFTLSGIAARLYRIYVMAEPQPRSPDTPVLRVALLGAASIAPHALLYPSLTVPEISVVAVGARDAARARALAERWAIPTHGSYEQVIHSDGIDAVYIALVNGAHYQWAASALRAGKHVLCEKPLTSNAAEARKLEKLAADKSLVLMEAYHNLHHPLTTRMRELVQSGELGSLTSIQLSSGLPGPDGFLPVLRAKLGRQPPAAVPAAEGTPRKAKMDPALGGGKFLGQGCYTISMARWLLSASDDDLASVDTAVMVEDVPGSKADVATDATLTSKHGVKVSVYHSSLGPGFDLTATFTNGSFTARNYLFPWIYHHLVVTYGRRLPAAGVHGEEDYYNRLVARWVPVSLRAAMGSRQADVLRATASVLRTLGSLYFSDWRIEQHYESRTPSASDPSGCGELEGRRTWGAMMPPIFTCVKEKKKAKEEEARSSSQIIKSQSSFALQLKAFAMAVRLRDLHAADETTYAHVLDKLGWGAKGKEARAEVEARLKRDPSAWALDATSPAAAVANMEMLDAIYTKSGLGLRG